MRKQGLMGGWCALLLQVGSIVGPASAGAQSTPTEAVDAATAAAQIDVNDLRLRLGIIADDSMRGRATPSPGLQKTAEYVAAQKAPAWRQHGR